MDVVVTKAILILSGLGIAVWDIYVARYNDIPNRFDTVSGIFRSFGRKYGALPFLLGVLVGHFWGPTMPRTVPATVAPFLLLIAAAFVVPAHNVLRSWFRLPSWFGLVWAGIGTIAGAIIWPQGF